MNNPYQTQGDYQEWLWERWGGQCVTNLKKRGFDAHWTADEESVAKLILELISGYQSFGFGGSLTTRSLGLHAKLKKMGKTVYDHWENDPEMSDREIRLLQGRCDCHLCSANAIALSGEIVNMDAVGNRNNAMAFGCKKVVIVAGMNKVARDLDSAIQRIREKAAPMRAKSLERNTPCVATGICADCDSPDRICNITTILHRKPMMTDLSVVLVNAKLGY